MAKPNSPQGPTLGDLKQIIEGRDGCQVQAHVNMEVGRFAIFEQRGRLSIQSDRVVVPFALIKLLAAQILSGEAQGELAAVQSVAATTGALGGKGVQ